MKSIFVAFLVIMASILSFCTIVSTQAVDVFQSTCDIAPESTTCKAAKEADGKNSLYGKDGALTRVVEILAYITGIAAVVVILISGLKYITSAGDSAGVASAKNGIIYAAVGLVIALFAQTIVAFVLKKIE